MKVVKLGPLRVRQVVKPPVRQEKGTVRPPLVVVLMHGYGAPGDDLVGLADSIDVGGGATFLFPEAPNSLAGAADMLGFLGGDARAWWDIDIGRFQRAMARGTLDELMDEVPPGMSIARSQLIEALDAIPDATGAPPERIVLGGFSQGSMLALDVALHDLRPLAGLVLWSSTLLAKSEWVPRMPPRKGLPVFQSHGTSDPILPYAIATTLRDTLSSAGAHVQFSTFAGGHGIPPNVLRDVGHWLDALA